MYYGHTMYIWTTPSISSLHISQLGGGGMAQSTQSQPCPQYKYIYLQLLGTSLMKRKHPRHWLPVGSGL